MSVLESRGPVEPLLAQSAWFRPHNRSEDFDNLYFVGAGTHPGAGLPGVLSSSKIAEDLIVAASTSGASITSHTPTEHAITGAA